MANKSRYNLGGSWAVVLLVLCPLTFAYKATPITPSTRSLIRQNQCADQMNLVRIQDDAELQRMVADGRLTALPMTKALSIAPSLPAGRRYVLSFVTPFLLTLSEQYYAKFGKPLVIDSAVRDADTQRRLRKRNRNAAPVDGETASSHETGATVDIAKRGMTSAQLQWTRAMLSYEVVMNRVIVEEERHQACFHTMVLGGTE